MPSCAHEHDTPDVPLQSVLLFSRYRDGSIPIKVMGVGRARTFEVTGDGGAVSKFSSARSLLKSFRGKDLHWTLDRYARIGRYQPTDIAGTPILDLLGTPDIVIDVPVIGEAPVQVTTSELAILTSKKTEAAFGIDLKARGHEVAKLLFAGFGQMIFASGYDADEVLQEVYRGILARNKGRCAWDARKSSFGHYVHMVCSCVLKNWHRREKRRRDIEQVGLPCFGDAGERTTGDVAGIASNFDPDHLTGRASVYQTEDSAADDLTAYIVKQGPCGDTMLALTLLPLVREGKGRGEIAVETGLSKPVVSRGLTYLREVARRWMALK